MRATRADCQAAGTQSLDRHTSLWHTIHMARTNLVLNMDLLVEAQQLAGERTYSRTVERALEDFIRRAKARRILDLAGSGAWSGDLSVVREDRPASRSKPEQRRGSR
jgi:Bacterial antitoxin of type II TA system, VapB